jgi:hypothetical protein
MRTGEPYYRAGRLKVIMSAAALLFFAAMLALAGCGHGPSEAACKTAMTRDYRYALAHPDAPAATRPAACKGISDATIQKIAAEIMASP